MARFFIERPVFACVLSIIITLVGLVALRRLPIVQYPEISPPIVRLTAVYPGASADILEETVATPIEQKINGSPGMIYMTSRSANDGTMNLDITFEVGTNLDLAAVDVQNRLSQAEPQLPEEVKRQGITVKKRSPDMLVVLGIVSPDGSRDALFLSNYASINLVDAIGRIPGVGDISQVGAGDYGMRIWVNPEKLTRLGLTVTDLTNALREQNLQAPAGQVGQPPVPAGQEFQYTVRVKGRLTEVSEFEEIILRSNNDGSQLRLKDVARVELGAKDYNLVGRIDGKPAALMILYQLPGANALDVVEKVRTLMEAQKSRFPAGVDYTISFDSTEFVKESINGVIHTLYEAFILVFLVTFLFLQNWRATLIPSIAVPVALVGTFAVFPMLGFSLNTLTLFAMVLAIGLLVDDAIVVVEAVELNMEHGLGPKEATIKAMEEVSGPIIAITLALFAVFLPVAFMGGITGVLYKQFAITLCVSVGLSAVNSLTLSPALCAIMLKPRHGLPRGPAGWVFGGFNKFLSGWTTGYLAIVRLFMRRGLVTLLVTGGMIFLMGGLFKKLPTGFVPDEDQGYAMSQLILPQAASLERTMNVAERAGARIQKINGVQTVMLLGGQNLMTNTIGPNVAALIVTMKNWADRKSVDLQISNIVKGIRQEFATEKEGLAITFLPPSLPGMGNVGGWQMQLQDMAGQTLLDLDRTSGEFAAALRERKELAGVSSNLNINTPQIELKLDREKTRTLGIPVSDVFNALQTFMAGFYVNDFNRFGRTYRVMLQAEPEYRRVPSDLGRFYVRSADGQMVPISTLSSTGPASGPDFLVRHNLYRTAEITGRPADGFSSGQAMKAITETAQTKLPKTFGFEWTGLSYQEAKAGAEAGLIMGLAILMVFLVLAAQYESWAVPLAVIFSIPVAICGALLFQSLRGFENNVYCQIGIVMLIGLAAKNAILIVEYALERRRKLKMPIFEAAMEAARLRFRPILMTSFAFILGCVPLVISKGAGAASRQAMGTAVVGGMLASTIIGILIIPALYLMAQRLGEIGDRPKPEPTTPMGEPEEGKAESKETPSDATASKGTSAA